jgi:hypothetical protein
MSEIIVVRGDATAVGCGPASGQWSRVQPLITERLVKRGVKVTVHDHEEAGS